MTDIQIASMKTLNADSSKWQSELKTEVLGKLCRLLTVLVVLASFAGILAGLLCGLLGIGLTVGFGSFVVGAGVYLPTLTDLGGVYLSPIKVPYPKV